MKEQKNDTTGINDGRRENRSYSQFKVDQKLHEEKEDWDLVASGWEKWGKDLED